MSPRHTGLVDIIQHFTPSWFAVVMGTGIIGILMNNLPLPGKNTREIIALAFLIGNSCLFLGFTAVSTARYIMFPRIWFLMLREPVQSLFLSCFPMALATLVSAATSLSQTRIHKPTNLIIFLWVLWWIDVFLSVASSIALPYIMVTRHNHSLESQNCLWLLPVVPLIVVASAGGVMTGALLNISSAKAAITAGVSCVMLVIGLTLFIMIATTYLFRLVANGFPKAGLVVSVFLPLGPCGQGGYALLVLCKHFATLAPLKTSFIDAEVYGKIVIAMATSGALALWSIGLWFGILSLIGITEISLSSSVAFKINFWGMVFPTGLYALLTLQLGVSLDLGIFRILGVILSAIVALLWLVIACKTLYQAIEGSIFHAPCLDDAPLNVTWQRPDMSQMGDSNSMVNGSAHARIPNGSR